MNLTNLILAAILSLPQPKDPMNLPRLAEDIAYAAELHDGAPFTGPARVEVLSIALVAIAYHESGLRQPVADCRVKGDEGRSVSAFMLMRGASWDGHSQQEICDSQTLAAYLSAKALKRYRKSRMPISWFRGYATGDPGKRADIATKHCKTWERLSTKAGLVVSCWNRTDVRWQDAQGG